MAEPMIEKLLRWTPLPWFVRNGVSRRSVIQRCIDARSAGMYLEIGVSDGRCFAAIRAPRKVGVDPIPAAPRVVEELKKPGVLYFDRTSDAFFEQDAPRVLADGVDVVFVDGLHTWEQAYRDCVNALRYLRPGGIILVHDCLPRTEGQAMVAGSIDEAAALAEARGIPWDWAWTGDTWKAIVALRQHPDLVAYVLECDRGVGVIHRGVREGGPRLSEAEIQGLGFADLSARAVDLLGLRRPFHLGRVLSAK